MALEFSTETREKLQTTLARYPNAMAACLPALHMAQREFGHISADVIDLVARELSLPPAHVWGVATFYTMYDKKPVAKHHVQVCTNVACMLRGGTAVLDLARDAASRHPNLFTVSEVECLAACGTAVCVQIDDDYHENMDPGSTNALLQKLAGEP